MTTQKTEDANAASPEPRGAALRLIPESAALLAALFILFHLIENYRGAREWRATEQRLADAGVDLEWQNYLPPPILDEDNFLMALDQDIFVRRRDMGRGARWSISSQAMFPLRSVPPTHNNAFRPGSLYDLSESANHIRKKALVPANSTDPVGDWLNQHAAILKTLITAANRPGTRFPADPNAPLFEQPIPAFVNLRATAQTFALRTQRAIEHRDAVTAVEGLRVIQQLRRSMESSPTLVAAMIGVAICAMEANLIQDGIQRGLWSDTQLERFQSQLAGSDLIQLLENSMALEIIHQVTVIEHHGLLKSFNASAKHSIFERAVPRGWIQQMNAYSANLSMDALLHAIDAGRHRIHFERFEESDRRLEEIDKSMCFFHLLAQVAIPNFFKAFETTARTQTLVDMTRIACALERHKNAKGNYPGRLDDLTPEWIDSVPHDVATGEPLIYRLEPGGSFTLYSRGPNQTDDGGVIGKGNKLLDWVWLGN